MQRSLEISRVMGGRDWSMLIALSILWGGSFFFNSVAVKELPVFTVVTVRVALAAAILYAIMRIMGLPMPKGWPLWGAFFGLGLINNAVPFCLIAWGQTHIASGVASILNATTPLFAVIVAHFFTGDEKMSWSRFFGVLIGLAGVAAMIGSEALGTPRVNIAAQLALLMAALCYAASGVFARQFWRMGVSPLATAASQMAASSIILTPIMLIVDRPLALAVPSTATLASLIGLASLSTALAYLLYFRILASAGATNVLLVTFLVPVSAILLGVVLLGEEIQSKHLAGMAMIALGLAAIDGRPGAAVKRNRFSRGVGDSS